MRISDWSSDVCSSDLPRPEKERSMKMAVRAMLVALATLALASPSFAATVAPTSYPFILKVDSFGSLYVIMPFITYQCGADMKSGHYKIEGPIAIETDIAMHGRVLGGPP